MGLSKEELMDPCEMNNQEELWNFGPTESNKFRFENRFEEK